MTTPSPALRPARQVGERLPIVALSTGERITATVIEVGRLTVLMEAPDGRKFVATRLEVH